MERINKAQARKLYEAGKPFWIVACNLKPECGILIGSCSFEFLTETPFDTMVSNYEYYNCSGCTGRYSAFYVDG